MKLKNKVALVTGASAGIGREIALLFGRQAAAVVVVGHRNDQGAQSVVDEINRGPGRALKLLADVSKAEAVQDMVAAALQRFGKIDILVNNAGIIGKVEAITEMSLADWERVYQTNVNSVFLCCRAVIPRMCAAGGGNIINMSSTAGYRASRISAAYAASKAAIIAITQSLALTYARDNIRVNTICPGSIETEMLSDVLNSPPTDAERSRMRQLFLERHALGRFGSPAEVAQGALYLAADDSAFVTGTILTIDGGLSL